MKRYTCGLLLVAYVLTASFAVADSVSDLPLPRGCTRIEYSPDTFSGWIQRMPLKEDTSILTFRGAMLSARVYDRFAVLERPLLFTEDLEQCADFAMRLWADYHAETDRLDELFLFNYTGGIGHVSMIVDACLDDSGNRYYLIGFSFMPSQEFHIERAPLGRIGGKRVGREYWFSYEGYIRFLHAYYPYGIPVLRRFGRNE